MGLFGVEICEGGSLFRLGFGGDAFSYQRIVILAKFAGI